MSITLQGGVMLTQAEAEQLEKNKVGTGYDLTRIKVKGKKGDANVLNVRTRKSRTATQTISMCKEAYDYMISSEMPHGYRAPKNFKPYTPTRSRLDRKTKKWVDGVPLEVQAWKAASIQQRLEWHLNATAASLGGRVDSYTVFND